MNMRKILSTTMRLAVVGVCVFTAAGCGNELLLTGRGAHLLVITGVEGASGQNPGTFVANLQSDVQVLIRSTVNDVEIVTPTIFNDLVRVTVQLIAKDQSGVLVGDVTQPSSPINVVTINRYRVIVPPNGWTEHARCGRAVWI